MEFEYMVNVIRRDLYEIIEEYPNMVDWEEDLEDKASDFDLLVSFNVTEKTICEIINLKGMIEELPLNVHIMLDQIVDQINDNEDIITIDFYCDIDITKV